MNEFLLKNQEAFIKFLKTFLIKFLYLKKKRLFEKHLRVTSKIFL